ncbi:WGR domain-containing protein [Actinokineospora cianjurensis]|uniref:WGR domain-containing protein n=1 Tax=Actinokineospora cianjurensis TaxID=585224 RepID=A0A421B248_9PSEU|nr:WGR domain-containing protein [Actinokineospora cianjurensis]RLK58464.1 WGR domain-containing protein [Actinokineospora cianjurensis]
MATPTVTAFGWELHNSSAGHDKFYRILLVEQFLLFNWGTRDGRGQFRGRKVDTVDVAKRSAAQQTDAKHAKGYLVTRDATPFTVPVDIVRDLTSLPVGKIKNPSPKICDEVVKLFKAAAARMGTALPEASR